MHPPDPLRLCTQCDPPHYDNCSECWGFGIRRSYADGEWSEHPMSAERAANVRNAIVPHGTIDACKVCGSTVDGAPQAPN